MNVYFMRTIRTEPCWRAHCLRAPASSCASVQGACEPTIIRRLRCRKKLFKASHSALLLLPVLYNRTHYERCANNYYGVIIIIALAMHPISSHRGRVILLLLLTTSLPLVSRYACFLHTTLKNYNIACRNDTPPYLYHNGQRSKVE